MWYSFRWVFKPVFSGRQQRIFDRGHREEARWLEWLLGIGCRVWHIDPETGKQYRVHFAEGHGGGALDYVVELPERYGYGPLLLLGDSKTSATGRKFSDLSSKSVRVVKPEHFTQICIYGAENNIKFGLYLAINKNDDDIYIEVFPIDYEEAERAKIRAVRIIFAQEAPPKLSESPQYDHCMACDNKPVCHGGDTGAVNCRSCKHAAPIQNKQWHCAHWDAVIPPENIPNGCTNWVTIL